jgi:plastocyanin
MRAFIAIVVAVVAAACGSNAYGPSSPANVEQKTVAALPSLVFTPATLAVASGDTVTFAFGSVAHNVFFDAAAGAPADIPGTVTNTRVGRVFAAAGRYTYSCHIHPEMHGTVVVGGAR